MRSDSTILLSGWSASRVSRRAKAGTNKNARHSPALTAHPPLRSWTVARAFIFSAVFPSFFSEPFPPLPFHSLPFRSFRPNPPPVPHCTFLVLFRSPSKTNQIFGEVLTHSSQRRWLPGALNVTVSPHMARKVRHRKSVRRSWLETLLYQFQTVATRSSVMLVFFFFSSWQHVRAFRLAVARNEKS